MQTIIPCEMGARNIKSFISRAVLSWQHVVSVCWQSSFPRF